LGRQRTCMASFRGTDDKGTVGALESVFYPLRTLATR
jgi:hypothetical protein